MRLWQNSQHPRHRGGCGPCGGLCGRRLTRRFWGISPEGKRCVEAAWEAVLRAKSDVSASRKKKHKIKGGGRKAPTPRSHRPATRAVPKDCGISPLLRPGWSVLRIFKFKVVGGARNPAFPRGCAVSGWKQYFFPLKAQTLRRYIKEKGRKKSPPKEFLTN